MQNAKKCRMQNANRGRAGGVEGGGTKCRMQNAECRMQDALKGGDVSASPRRTRYSCWRLLPVLPPVGRLPLLTCGTVLAEARPTVPPPVSGACCTTSKSMTDRL